MKEIKTRKGIFLGMGLAVSLSLAMADDAARADTTGNAAEQSQQISRQGEHRGDRQQEFASEEEKQSLEEKTKEEKEQKGEIQRLELAEAEKISRAGESENGENLIQADEGMGNYTIENRQIDLRHMEYITDVVNDLPGVITDGTSVMNQRIFMRGIAQQGINVQIDGARQIGRQSKEAESVPLDPAMLRSARVDPGAVSVVGNSGALGGSIILTTLSAGDLLKPGQKFGYKLRGQFDTNGLAPSAGVTVYGRYGKFDGLAYIASKWHTFSKTGDHVWGSPGQKKEVKFVNGKEDLLIAGENKIIRIERVQKLTGGRGSKVSALLKGDFYPNEISRMTVGYSYNLNSGIYNRNSDRALDPDVKKRNYTRMAMSRQTVTTDYAIKPSENFRLDWNAYYNLVNLRKSRSTDEKQFPSHKSPGFYSIYTHNYGTKLIANTVLDTQRILKRSNSKLVYGFEFFGTEQYARDLVRMDDVNESNKNETSVQVGSAGHDVAMNISSFLEYRFGLKMGITEMVFIPGLRSDFYRITTYVDIPIAVGKSGHKIVNSYNNISPAFAAMFKVVGVTAFANYAKLFKGPGVYDGTTLAYQGKFGTQHSLKPETGNNFTAGVAYNFHRGMVDVDIMAKAFYIKYRNLMAITLREDEKIHIDKSRTSSSNEVLSKQSFTDATAHGGEAGLKVRVAEDVGITLTYTKTEFTSETHKSAVQGVRSGASSGQTSGSNYSLNTEYTFRTLGLTLGMNHMAQAAYDIDKPDKDPGKFTREHKPGYYVADIYAVLEPKALRGLSVSVGAYNIFNEAYITQTALYYPPSDYDIGLNIKASAVYKY